MMTAAGFAQPTDTTTEARSCLSAAIGRYLSGGIEAGG